MLETLDAQPKTLVSRDNIRKICNIGTHRPLSCNMLRRMNPEDRRQAMTKIAGCANCLSNYHKTNSCPSPMTCRSCRQRHHSMLHKHAESTAPVVAIATRDLALQAMDVSGPNQQTPMINKVSNTYVLLATAIVAIQGQTAKREKCRAVIDLGSHLNLMSRRMADQLGLPTFSTSQGILGIGQTAQGSSSWARVLLSSLSSNFQKEIDVFILPQLIKNQPNWIAHVGPQLGQKQS